MTLYIAASHITMAIVIAFLLCRILRARTWVIFGGANFREKPVHDVALK